MIEELIYDLCDRVSRDMTLFFKKRVHLEFDIGSIPDGDYTKHEAILSVNERRIYVNVFYTKNGSPINGREEAARNILLSIFEFGIHSNPLTEIK